MVVVLATTELMVEMVMVVAVVLFLTQNNIVVVGQLIVMVNQVHSVYTMAVLTYSNANTKINLIQVQVAVQARFGLVKLI